jgi:CheY-like chemotaxis protein
MAEIGPDADAAQTGIGHGGASHRPQILVVDDDDAAAEALTDYLEMGGYRVIRARDGYEAIERLVAGRPDVILMDVMMPGLDGLAATRRIRDMDDVGRVPIIMVSALAASDDEARGLAAGADEYLSKPISVRQLTGAIQRQLARAGDGGEHER